MGEDREKPAKRPIISIKLDKGAVLAIVSLFGVAGVGYGQYVQPGKADLEATRTGTDLQVNEAYASTATKIRKLADVSKAQAIEIEQLHDTNEWLAASIAELGKSHPAALRKIKRKASGPFEGGFGFARRESSGDPLDEIEDEHEVFEEIESMPKRIEFPAMDRIRDTMRRNK